jgi:flagellar motility protein MotE (MotC chaperone)
MTGVRLLPVLIFGLVSLLSIKLMTMALNAPTYERPDPNASGFERAITIARQGPQEAEIITGSVGKKDEKPTDPKAEPTPEEKAANEKAKAELKKKMETEGTHLPIPNGSAAAPVNSSPEERALLEKLRDRRGEIEARNRDLELRDNLLRLSERKVDEKIGELRSLEGQMGKSNPQNDAKARYRPLVVMYESMKPKDAARVFDRLDLVVLISLVDQMNPRKMSEILAAMEPATAEKLTVALARKAASGDGGMTENPQGKPNDTELPRLPVK